MSNVHAPTYLNWSPMALCTPILQIGSFCRYQVTVHIQQKKQCNQTIKAPGKLYCLVLLFLL